jgi:hypothetical protein
LPAGLQLTTERHDQAVHPHAKKYSYLIHSTGRNLAIGVYSRD